jgi:NAD(P)H dehydrogenase (quinone)
MRPLRERIRAASLSASSKIPNRTAARFIRSYGPVELTHDEIAKLVGGVLGREITYQSLPIEKWAEVVVGASAGRPPRNDAGALYPEADRITGRAGSEFLVQHVREVAIDHTNGIFAGTNKFVETIGGQPPLTVEAFVAKHREAFV